MAKISWSFIVFALLFNQCTDVKKQPTESKSTDPHSFSLPDDARVKHLSWNATVDFDTKIINAVATWDIEHSRDADLIIFDTKNLTIKKVTAADGGKPLEYRLADPDSLLGQALAVLIPPDTKKVVIEYQTSPDAEALQWLSPSQTAGKKHPFLFTQSQAILARSWIPCQDSPAIRFTYDAEVHVPTELLALMSAANPQQKNASGIYKFEMRQPIPSYLLALSVGDIAFKPVSARAGVYAEPSVVESAAWEFADLEKMIAGAEALYGKYAWDRYDVIVLPPSFPFGGMENPRLTFVTPTLLAGDRSLTSVIAHELAHSWSGNLVTNATWNDFWLNEGFTVYFEHRIIEALYGHEDAEMHALLALQDLKATIDDLTAANNINDTKLRLDLKGRNPDDAVTDIAYNKGYFFLRSIEEKYGRDKFDAFVRDYFSGHSFQSVNTDLFVAAVKEYYSKNHSITLPDTLFNNWIFTPGLPADCPTPVATKFAPIDSALATFARDGKSLPAKVSWGTQEWLHFIKNLPDTLNVEQLSSLDKFGKLTASGNAEILTVWLVVAIKNNYAPAYPKLEQFLVNTGRRKFLSPLYNALVKTPEGRERAAEIYRKARPNYHFVATSTFDTLIPL
ncbi:MAG TPA: M1 family metallopeptidase [Chryseolinea sp.]|nr:M1 family metallopeptidase [Chryseolinea sp.]